MRDECINELISKTMIKVAQEINKDDDSIYNHSNNHDDVKIVAKFKNKYKM